MQSAKINRLISAFEKARRARPGADATLALLAKARASRIRDAAQLAQLHDALLFVRAYPENARVMRESEALLGGFGARVKALGRDADLSPLLDTAVSGIAGTSVTAKFSSDFARWVTRRFPGEAEIDWDDDSDEKLAAILPGFLPFLEERTAADANVSPLAWLKASGAMAKDGGLAWLVHNLDTAPIPPRARAALFDNLGLWLRWNLGNSPMTRTLMRRETKRMFYDAGPLLARRDVSLEREIASANLPVKWLSRDEGEAMLDMARAIVTTRCRELYGFYFGDPSAVLSADAGRGLEIVVCGLARDHRLPLRAGFSTVVFRNGVPIAYGDAYGLGDRLEVSLNVFYAFRDGESAYCYARMLKLYNQLLGSTAFSVDPYQIGLGNDEAIASGAFWFYRKLGFRSTDDAVERLAAREDERIASRSAYRSSARLLKRFAQHPMIFETAGAEHGAWDAFAIENIGLAIQRAMAKSGQSTAVFCQASAARVTSALGVRLQALAPRERAALEKLALVLDLIRDLRTWPATGKQALLAIVRAKTARREVRYLRLLARHTRLRKALRQLGRNRR